MAKKKSTVNKNETKREKFVRVVTPRVNKAIKAIELVGNQAGAAYEPTAADIANVITAMRSAVDKVEKRFNTKGTTSAGFTLE